MPASGPTLLPAFFNTDAEFRSWAQAFHDALTAAGWVRTSDTGQIDLTTVVKPAAINTSQGYEIWRMADSQQTAMPCFMKIEFGSGGAVDRPSLWVTLGTAANGSGTLTGNTTARQQLAVAASKTAGVTLPTYFSGNTDRFSFVTNYDSTGNTFAVAACFERTADANGTATADGVISFQHVSGTNVQYVLTPVGQAVPSAITSGPWYDLAITNQVTSIGNNVALVPGIVLVGKPFFMRSFACYKNADIAGGSAVTVTTSAGNHAYTTFSTSGLNCTALGAAGNNQALAMIFE